MKTQFEIKGLIQIVFLAVSLVGAIFSQTTDLPQEGVTYDLRIEKIEIPNASNKEALAKGFTYDLDVQWGLYLIDEEGQERKADSLITKSAVIWSTKEDFSKSKRIELTDKSFRVPGLKVGKQRYHVKVEATLINGQQVASDVKSVMHGLAVLWPKWPIPMFFPINLILTNEVYDNSTKLGKFAFTAVWYLFFFGLWVIYKCSFIRLKRIFPLYNRQNISVFDKWFKKDYLFEISLAPKFRFIVEAWKSIIEKNTEFISKHLSALKNNDPEIVQQHRALMDKSADALQVLIKLIEYDYENCVQKDVQKLVNDVKSIFGRKSNFYDFVSNGIHVISNGYRVDLNWQDIEDDLCPNRQKNCSGGHARCCNLLAFPATKILLAGLENHFNNIFDWEKASEEVDRAIENRTLVEFAAIKEKSSVEQLWNYGAIAPLLGLFGTVTGITSVFQSISSTSGLEMEQMIKVLAKGIYEALWTTIFGLIVGIVMMSLYYLFKTRLESLQNRCATVSVHITERL